MNKSSSILFIYKTIKKQHINWHKQLIIIFKFYYLEKNKNTLMIYYMY